MHRHRQQKRATAASPSRAFGLRAIRVAALSAVALTGTAGALAAAATDALGSTATGTTPTGTTTTAATTTAATTTAATTTATTTTATTTTATTTRTTAAAAKTTGTTAAGISTTTPATGATTATTPALTTTAPATTTQTTRTATTPRTTTTTAPTSTLAKVTSTQIQHTSAVATVTVTVTTPAPATATATATSTSSASSNSADDADDADDDADPNGAVGDPLSTSLGTDSGSLLAQSELTEAVLGDKPPAKLVPIYKAAASVYGVPWEILAAINAVESDYGTDEGTSSAGAVGWMQFEPATFAKYEIPNGTGTSPSPYNAIDAIFAAAHLLAANGATTNLRKAIYSYNHADSYVDEVTFVAAQIVGAETEKSATTDDKIASMTTTAKLLSGTPYVWGGGHGSWTASDGYDCSGFVSAVLHAAGYLTEPETTQTLPSATDIETGPGTYVTMFDRTDAAGIADDHVIIDIDGQWWEAGGGAGDGGADDVHRIADVSAAYLASFNLELHPRGL